MTTNGGYRDDDDDDGDGDDDDDDDDDRVDRPSSPFLAGGAPTYPTFSSSCSRPGGGAPPPPDFLSCSPMLSTPRANALRLPDLDLREARRAALFAAAEGRLSTIMSAKSTRELCQNAVEEMRSGEGGGEHHRRSRSQSLGSSCERSSLGGNSNHSSSLLLHGGGGSNHSLGYLSRGEAQPFGGRARYPSRLGLMNLSGDVGGFETTDREGKEVELGKNGNGGGRGGGYGSTTAGLDVHARQQQSPNDGMAGAGGADDPVEPSPETSRRAAPPPPPRADPHPIPPSTPPDRSRGSGGRRAAEIIDDPLLRDLRREFASQSNPQMVSLLYGMINTSIVLPIVMSFGSIIYRDDFFRPYLSGLIQLTIVSGAVHQISFSTFSTLPFAVGSVQDAGLIFLSSMASDLVARLRKVGADDATILATVTIGLSVYTTVLGFALILVGRFRLASYCKLLPTTVVGGYLGYIGFFCGQAGLASMAEVDVSGLTEWGKFFDVEALILMTPGVIGGCAIYYSVRTFRAMAVLPTCIVMLMVIFYGILRATGTSVQDATQYGWINKNFMQSPAWYHTWEHLKLEKVAWRVLPTQVLTVVAMICVVSLSSSLDIAAIEIELRRPLDYNHELRTVGLSNIVSGLTGGYTGSYIFSQSIFSLKMGIRSRLMGFSLAFFILVFWMIPINLLSYVPNFFFGSLLLLICLDLMFEWLIDVRRGITRAEYATVLSTFALLQMLGLELGIFAGCLLHVAMVRWGFNMGNDEKVNEDDMAIANYKTTDQ